MNDVQDPPIAEQERLDRLVLGIAHELNNPNAFIRLGATNLRQMVWLLRPCCDEYAAAHPDVRFGPYDLAALRVRIDEQLEAILGATVRLSAIAERLKQCTAVALDDRAPVDLRDVVADMVAAHEFLFAADTRVAFAAPAAGACVVSGYRLLLEQAIAVLLTNAHDAIVARHGTGGGRDGRLDVELGEDGRDVVLRIRDDGCGMTPDHLARAFTPYFTTKAGGGGDGLGLPLCRSIIQRHGGTVAIASARGRGTTVTVRLPRREEDRHG